MHKIIVSGVGCCLVDVLYNHIDFNSRDMKPYLSKNRGDGGLSPGKLVLQEEFEKYSGATLDQFIHAITGGRDCDMINIGGPSVVSLINAAQLTDREKCEVRFYGRNGNDVNGKYLLTSLTKTPIVLKDYRQIENRTPSTLVLSDPTYDKGHGERMFINSIGAAWDYHPEELDDDFFNSDLVVFGGTALVPHIHDHLTSLLKKARSRGCSTVVNTVFDFRNEKANPLKRWPLGESEESYRYIDLLITDKEEALRLSGEDSMDDAINFFRGNRVHSLVITNGADNILAYSDGSFFNATGLLTLPSSDKIRRELEKPHGGDTTGCGDNFAGGMIASMVNQMIRGNKPPDLKEACSWGIISGGFTCFYMGGTYFEKQPGEKLVRINPYYDAYQVQLSV